jgi:hypothetical protein
MDISSKNWEFEIEKMLNFDHQYLQKQGRYKSQKWGVITDPFSTLDGGSKSQNRVENLILIILDLFPMKNTQLCRFWTIFSEMVDFCMGPFLTPYLTPTFFFLVFLRDFEKRNRFAAFSHPKMIIWGFFREMARKSLHNQMYTYIFSD